MSKQNHGVRWSRLMFAAMGLCIAAHALLACAQPNIARMKTAELIANRDFENVVPDGWRVEGTNVFTLRGGHVGKWFTIDLSHWHATAENGAEGEIVQDSESPSNERASRSLKLTIKKPAGRFV